MSERGKKVLGAEGFLSVIEMLRQLACAEPATIAECSILENRKQLATG